MRHPSTRAVLAHWETLARGPRPPRRESVDPVAMRLALRDVFIVERHPGRDATFALGGTRLCALLGGEVRGVRFTEAWGDPTVAAVILAAVEAGTVQAGEAFATGADGGDHAFEFVMMPLTWRGIPGAALLGAVAPVGPDAWSGQPVSPPRIRPRRAPVPRAGRRPDLRLVAGGGE